MIREAQPGDVTEINRLRLDVRENQLTDPSWLTEEVTLRAITARGRGWVFEESGQILGFSIALLEEQEIWALFVDPAHEAQGIGKLLLHQAVEWLWQKGAKRIVLSTSPGTRAETFYRKQGWREDGRNSKGEVCFELLKD